MEAERLLPAGIYVRYLCHFDASGVYLTGPDPNSVPTLTVFGTIIFDFGGAITSLPKAGIRKPDPRIYRMVYEAQALADLHALLALTPASIGG
ncbi:MAG: hypothetical protein ABI668_11925 [Sphingorhabdus sp.]